MSVLGLDIGEKRIGMALGTVLAEEYGTLIIEPPYQSFLDEEQGEQQALDKILEVVDKERVEEIVIGLPLRPDGTDSHQAKKIRRLATRLEEISALPIHLVDETLTSFAAEEMLRDEGLTIAEAKKRVDQVSAKLILQQYLEGEN